MVLSGKIAPGGETAYFTNSTWATAGSGSTLAYTATLDFAVTDATWGSPAQPTRVFFMDLEIRDASNTVRGTWQFELELHRENYGSGDTPDDPDEPFLDRPAADNIYLSFDAAQTLTSGQKMQGQTNLGGSTVGRAVFSLTNPSAVTWLRVNADNTVTARTAAETRSDIGSGDILNSGTITLANAGKVAVITALNTIGAGVAYASAATASTLALRDASGAIYATGSLQAGTAVTHDSSISSPAVGALVAVSGDGDGMIQSAPFYSAAAENNTMALRDGTGGLTATTFTSSGATITVNGKTLTAPAASGTLALTSDIVFATTAQEVAGTSSSVITSPASGHVKQLYQAYRLAFSAAGFVQAVSGTGAATSTSDWGVDVTGPTTATGYGIRRNAPTNQFAPSRGKGRGVIAWGRRVELVGTACIYAGLDANAVLRVTFGKTTGDNAGNLARRGLGIRVQGTGALEIETHNGTTRTASTNSTFTPTVNQAFDFRVTSDGAGNCVLWVNDTQVATCTGGPTTDSSSTENALQAEIENVSTVTTQSSATVGNLGVYLARS
jgi:hypothetical protein